MTGTSPSNAAPPAPLPSALTLALGALGGAEAGLPLTHYLRDVVANFVVGNTVLPCALGLREATLRGLMGRHFGDPHILERLNFAVSQHTPGVAMDARMKSELRSDLAGMRQDERDSLEELLLSGVRGTPDRDQRAMARIVASGCLGPRHLWSDTGFTSRRHLRGTLELCFPELAALNVHDMRWKRFFYRQICERGGDYVCRAPTCGECSSRAECFVTPEEATKN